MLDRRKLLSGLASAPFATTAAEQSGLPLVGVLSPASPQAAVIKLVNEPFKKAMAGLGHVPGRTIDYAERYADGDDSRLPALAAELVALRPSVLFTNGNAAAAALAKATPTIPLVIGPASEVVITELAGGSLARPLSNVTGFVLTSWEIDAKCISLLVEAMPSIRRIGIVANPNNPGQRDYPGALAVGVGTSGASLKRYDATGASDMVAALAKAAQDIVDALFVADDLHIVANPAAREIVLRFAAEKNIPVGSSHQNYARDGAVLAMGPSIPMLAARGADYVDKILKGTTVAFLPVQRPTVFTTVVNLKTAKQLGVALPTSILLRADELIE